jgi:uncharacterized membrane protein YecN with MAPEG domain
MSFPVTSLVAGVFALMMVALSLSVSLRRIAVRSASSGQKDDVLRRRIRAFGNFAEYAPTMLVLLALVEAGGAAGALLWALAAAFVASRAVHAAGMLYAATPRLRAGAMVLQHAAFAVAGGWLLLRLLA